MPQELRTRLLVPHLDLTRRTERADASRSCAMLPDDMMSQQVADGLRVMNVAFVPEEIPVERIEEAG